VQVKGGEVQVKGGEVQVNGGEVQGKGGDVQVNGGEVQGNGGEVQGNGGEVQGNGGEVQGKGGEVQVNGGEVQRSGVAKEVRTTMVVRLHPGQANRLSAYLEDQGAPGTRRWLAEMQPGDASSILGLEISFTSVPQDIDIKVLPGTMEAETAELQVQDESKPRE